MFDVTLAGVFSVFVSPACNSQVVQSETELILNVPFKTHELEPDDEAQDVFLTFLWTRCWVISVLQSQSHVDWTVNFTPR